MKKLPKLAIAGIGLAASILLLIIGTLLNESDFTVVLFLLGSISLYVFTILLIVFSIMAIVSRIRKKHPPKPPAEPAPVQRTYTAIHATPFEKENERETGQAARKFTYNTGERFHLSKDGPAITWPIVVLFLFLLFPFGAFLAIAKTVYEKQYYTQNGKRLRVTGLCFLLFSIQSFAMLLISVHMGDDPSDILPLAILFGGVWFLAGLLLFVIGTAVRNRGRENDRYLTAITVDRVTSIPALCERMHVSYAKAVKVIQRLIDTGLLPNAYIYHQDREVIVSGISTRIARRCRTCSGTTVLYANDPQICVYCGGAL